MDAAFTFGGRVMRSNEKHEWLFLLIIAAITIGLMFTDLVKRPAPCESQRWRAKVLSVDNSLVKTNLIVKTEEQLLTVKFLGGPDRGQKLEIANLLTGKMEFDEIYQTGDVILVEYSYGKDGRPRNGLTRGHYRLRLEIALITLFGCLLLLVAGKTGLKAMLSFVFVAVVLWKLYFPLLLLGYPPLSTGLGIVALLTAVITLSVGGFNRRGLATFAGSMMGVLFTCGLAIWFTWAFHLHGAVRPFAETLLYSGHYDLNLTHIFIASVFIASSGAVMDLAMDIAASMGELKHKHPDIGFLEHVRSGLRVGRAVIGTMTTTLLLAYTSSHIAMFLLFIDKGLPAANLLNAPFVAAEILNILVGSFGLVTVAPFTVLVSGLLFRSKTAVPGTACPD